MDREKTILEVIAPSIEEAIEKGLGQLGMTRDMVEIEILDSGSKGLLGIGGRQSRVKMAVKTFETLIDEVVVPEDLPVDEPRVVQENTKSMAESDLTEDELVNLKATRKIVLELLDRMRVKAEITARYVEPKDEKDEPIVVVDIEGKDLSILIGRRSETLNALQYISSLIVSKELGRWVPMLIDVQGYRSRRERQLRQLGRRMAEQAIQTGRKQTLEPMPANERRVIHLELREHPHVYTESIGEEPYRKVTILLKNQ